MGKVLSVLRLRKSVTQLNDLECNVLTRQVFRNLASYVPNASPVLFEQTNPIPVLQNSRNVSLASSMNNSAVILADSAHCCQELTPLVRDVCFHYSHLTTPSLPLNFTSTNVSVTSNF